MRTDWLLNGDSASDGSSDWFRGIHSSSPEQRPENRGFVQPRARKGLTVDFNRPIPHEYSSLRRKV